MLRKLVLLVLFSLASSAPTSFDQRQQGELNVKVDLDNFVILLARPSSSSSSGLDLFGSMAQLLADAKRAQISQEAPKNEEEESIKADFGSLEDVEQKHPEVLVVVQDDDKVAENVARNLKNKYKFVEESDEPKKLKLVGDDAVENCGPGRSRDRLGICQGDPVQA